MGVEIRPGYGGSDFIRIDSQGILEVGVNFSRLFRPFKAVLDRLRRQLMGVDPSDEAIIRDLDWK